jgi:hypothetical protein
LKSITNRERVSFDVNEFGRLGNGGGGTERVERVERVKRAEGTGESESGERSRVKLESGFDWTSKELPRKFAYDSLQITVRRD